MEQEQFIYEAKKVELNIAAAGQLAEKTLHLPAGVCFRMAGVWTGTKPTQFVNLTVLDNGAEKVQGMDFQFFVKSSSGSFIDSLFPVTFDANRTITVQLSAKAALAADFNLQVVFWIRRPLPTL